MPVLRDIKFSVDRNQIRRQQLKSDASPALMEAFDWAVARADELLQPAVAYTVLKSEGVQGEELVLEGGARLRLGPHADLAAQGELFIASVASIGPALEAEVHELMAGSDPLKGYLLDCAGVVAVGQTSMAMREVVEGMARERGWGVSASMYPGSPMGWPTRGQKELVGLIPVDEIGVTLTSSLMLKPQKSSATLVGIGAGYTDAVIASHCHWCALQDSCWRRKDRAAARA